MALLPRVVDLVAGSNIPIIAAGGIVDARGYVAALALGAQGICLGTRSTNYSNIWHLWIYPKSYVLPKLSKIDVYHHQCGEQHGKRKPHSVDNFFFPTSLSSNQ